MHNIFTKCIANSVWAIFWSYDNANLSMGCNEWPFRIIVFMAKISLFLLFDESHFVDWFAYHVVSKIICIFSHKIIIWKLCVHILYNKFKPGHIYGIVKHKYKANEAYFDHIDCNVEKTSNILIVLWVVLHPFLVLFCLLYDVLTVLAYNPRE